MPTIQQIAIANESEGGGLVVVLTTLPKHELEERGGVLKFNRENALPCPAHTHLGSTSVARNVIYHEHSLLAQACIAILA